MTSRRVGFLETYYGSSAMSVNIRVLYMVGLALVGGLAIWASMYDEDGITRLYSSSNDNVEPSEQFGGKKYLCGPCDHMCVLAGPNGDIGMTACQCVLPVVGRATPSGCGCIYCS